MFLTDNEIQALTGHKRRHKQIAWLRETGDPAHRLGRWGSLSWL